MAVTEPQRHKLYNHLEELLGAEDASVLMQHLPPGGSDRLATKEGVARSADALRADFDGLRGEFDGLRGEFDGLRGEFDAHRTATKQDLEALELRFEARLERSLRESTNRLVTLIVSLVVMQTAVLGLLLTAA